MPHIRQAIYKLLTRLKSKQEPYQIAITEKLGGSQTLSKLRTIRVVTMLSLVRLSLASFSPLPPARVPSDLCSLLCAVTLPACCIFRTGFLFCANKKAFFSPLVPRSVSPCVTLGGMDTYKISNFRTSLPSARVEACDCHLYIPHQGRVDPSRLLLHFWPTPQSI